ncbi:type IV pilus assembly protein PilM [Wenzhouxiangella marina]|uniref:Fimbrial assembly protein n=1 Tax=Wenzhouxiangella marina TaxID=1579979 RepID=A0A0K0XYZ7_9GAMM|nr:type IV pilus assembly protein PilM [Wenzhouxiangella marina]AKS42846.1 Fimbrial assembly protein [Wenzhouxiangella marina]MBB6087473.1 type IV pilus assembly protein PilM [Wenzhouxiangella marina]
MNELFAKLFGSAPAPLVGVDIGTSSVKLIQLSASGNSYRVEGFAVEPVPEGAVSEGVIAEPEQVAEAVKKGLQRAGIKAKNCALAVTGSAVITKVINLPADLSEDDIEGQIEVEAGQYIPYPREEVSLDFEVLGPSPRNADLLEILLAASKTEHVDVRREVAELAGLTATVVDVEAYAIANAFQLVRKGAGIDDSETVGVLNIGSTVSTMIVLRGERSIYSREHGFGGHQLVEECMRRYGMDAEQASFLQRGEEPPAGFEDEVLEPFRQNVIQQISRALQFYSSSSDYSSISTLFLTGGGASIPGLAEAVGNEVGISCEVADPLKELRLSPKINTRELDQARPALTTACGLALRGFD